MFLKTLEGIFQKNESVARYLKTLDGKSSETYSHSVNVAFHVFERLTKDKDFAYTSKEIEAWTSAALVHDAGKLTTDNDILHSNADLRGEKVSKEESDKQFSTMMRHSIDGYGVCQTRFNFSKEEVAAIIGHHISSEYLENGPQNGFVGASNSREQWQNEFEEGYIEGLLVENLSWMEEKDIHALETISFCDDIEALRSTDRAYKLQHYWDRDDFDTVDKLGRKHGQSVEGIIQENIANGRLSQSFNGVVLSKSFQKSFDEMQDLNAPSIVRDMVGEYTKGVSVRVYEDKARDIEKNPELGKLFYEKRLDAMGKESLVFESKYLEKPVFYTPKSTPLLQMGSTQSKQSQSFGNVSVELESIDKLMEEYDLEVKEKTGKLLGILDDAAQNHVEKPMDLSIEDLEDFEM